MLTTYREIAIKYARFNLTYAACEDKKNNTKKLNNGVVLETLFTEFSWNHLWGVGVCLVKVSTVMSVAIGRSRTLNPCFNTKCQYFLFISLFIYLFIYLSSYWKTKTYKESSIVSPSAWWVVISTQKHGYLLFVFIIRKEWRTDGPIATLTQLIRCEGEQAREMKSWRGEIINNERGSSTENGTNINKGASAVRQGERH